MYNFICIVIDDILKDVTSCVHNGTSSVNVCTYNNPNVSMTNLCERSPLIVTATTICFHITHSLTHSICTHICTHVLF